MKGGDEINTRRPNRTLCNLATVLKQQEKRENNYGTSNYSGKYRWLVNGL